MSTFVSGLSAGGSASSESDQVLFTVAYIAEAQVLGLPKFARIAHQFAHRLQLQERLTHQIADEIERVTASNDVMVVGTTSLYEYVGD